MSRRTRSMTGTSSSGTISRRKRLRIVSYRETDSDNDYEQDSNIENHPPKVARKSVRSQGKAMTGPALRTKQSAQVSAHGSRQQQKQQSSEWTTSNKTASSANTPWHTLEYDILFDIFTYAYRLLKSDKKSSANTWLIRTATTCKAFQIPALGALYQCPPLDSVEAARGFLAAAADRPDFSKAKVKHIKIEAIPTLTRKDKFHEQITLEGILDQVPNVRSLAAEVHEDDPSSKRSVVNFTSRNRVNVYRPAMIDVMTKNKTRLQSMRWNYFFNSDQTWPWCVLPDVHRSPCMQTIENLEILWLNVFTKQIHKAEHLEALVEAIQVLPNLKSLTFSLCNLFSASDSILKNLPSSLEELTLIDCDDLDSETLESFLVDHGSNIRCLTLSHNRHLDLGFMRVLRTACPRLEIYKVDMSCYGLMLTSTDSEPSFRLLLPEGSVPTWPTSLRQIEMSYLRKWGRDAATVFFQSLVDSAKAKDLENLRTLIIKTTVDLDWRDRVAFRDEWTQRLQKIFKRQPTPPRIGIHSYVELSIAKHSNGKISGMVKKPNGTNQIPKDANGTTKDSIATRLRRRSLDNTVNESGIEKHSKSGTDSSLSKTARPPFIQGLCNIVEIRIENLRPMETQYAERDFMDEELSGDEDWTGEDSHDSHTGERYAW